MDALTPFTLLRPGTAAEAAALLAATPGARLDANLFEVTRDGQPVDYLGILVKRQSPTPADYVAIAPGKSISGSTELTRHYDMASGGEYLVSYRLDVPSGNRLAELAQRMVDEAEIKAAFCSERSSDDKDPPRTNHSCPTTGSKGPARSSSPC